MYRLSVELNKKLALLAQRKLSKGELLLLSKAIADSIPLAPCDTDNIALYTLTKRSYVDEVIYGINDFSYLDESERKSVYKLIDEFSLWRYNVAHNPPIIFFKGDTNTVIDDISGLLRYVDVGSLCSVADMIDNANWIYGVFRELTSEVKLLEASRSENK